MKASIFATPCGVGNLRQQFALSFIRLATTITKAQQDRKTATVHVPASLFAFIPSSQHPLPSLDYLVLTRRLLFNVGNE
ncbi:unnamed protein product [Tilletia controversa]|nr:unnamed protein product [Tilletia controversa]